ncbi:uncharacterized protein B0H18DRAFT_1119722 [Fomitopsis serialis]|uniref:uncharacterized protein n=1 Tax=Fomitopsis serialis TaxID=139415 RepID=UPI0020072CD5|nr:uncharacterized protein B0H18DRAFT_1119722 [Neoantrodia serialis]KAH9924933.1 hypothetical protein B0H18DRAFT_1119722 [Neoantrodia serialis]
MSSVEPRSKTDIYLGFFERNPVPTGDRNMKIWTKTWMWATDVYGKGCSREERRLENARVKIAFDDKIMRPFAERGSPEFFAWLRATYPAAAKLFERWKARTMQDAGKGIPSGQSPEGLAQTKTNGEAVQEGVPV